MRGEEKEEKDWESLVTELKETVPNEVDSHIYMEASENFCVDADVLLPEQLDAYSVGNLTMYRHVFRDEEKEELMKILLAEFEWNKDMMSKTSYRVKDDMLENGEKETALSLDYNENGTIIVQSRAISASSGPLSEHYSEWGIFIFDEKEEDPDYFELLKQIENDCLEFASVEEVKKYTKEFTEKLEIKFDCESEVYAFSTDKIESMVEQQKKFYDEINVTDVEMEQSVTNEDEAYCVVLLQGAGGIPLFPYEISSTVTNTTFAGSQCYAFYSAQGIVDMKIRNVYDIENIGEDKEILSLGEILETHYNQRGKQNSAKEKVIKIRLYYLPICVDESNLKFEAKPVWYILSNVERGTEGLKNSTREAVVYDAVTGEELPW